ncbi:glycosyltransferase family 2 protein [Loktanella agnita]|uniref:glycosyltransferase family 2 protein n=1 Tax=Loktanella agnita TaxID=287097 RepID=UPI003988540B
MTQNRPTWAVVATVDEPPALVQVFVDWYRRLGASEIFLYFDQPDDPAATGLPDMVTVCRCDADHWARLGKRRPEKHQIRQLRNATDAYRNMQSDWLLHVDADEYLWATQPVADCLTRFDATTDCAIVPVAERVFVAEQAHVPLAGPFRRPFTGAVAQGRALFGPDYALSLRGLTGHAIGKSFTRAGQELEISIHRPRYLKSAPDRDVKMERASGLDLLHFDGLTRLHWVYKLLRKADAYLNHNGMEPSPHRQRQITAVLQDRAAAYALHDRLKLMNDATLQQLDTLGLLLDPPFDPLAGTGVSLTSDDVDDWLRHKGLDLMGL